MRTLVMLAVMGVCSATYQPYNHAYNPHGAAAPVQPKWTGPVAATVPAGVNGKVIPVSDTQEVAAARNAFFKVYKDQLSSLGGQQQYGAPGYTHAAPAVSHAAPAVTHAAPSHSYSSPVYTPTHSYGAPAHGTPAYSATGPVGDTPEVAAAKAEFFRTFKQQAAAAAAAPDDHVIYH
ncbi:cuticle protein CP1876-like [Panulirus ornatus]|uniref:cuticle protein CP1876-like n=1 Tax=Panulirus ornatus TaxID=150431 RepID=UPI003A86B8C9